jgi:hypothetical protein
MLPPPSGVFRQTPPWQLSPAVEQRGLRLQHCSPVAPQGPESMAGASGVAWQIPAWQDWPLTVHWRAPGPPPVQQASPLPPQGASRRGAASGVALHTFCWQLWPATVQRGVVMQQVSPLPPQAPSMRGPASEAAWQIPAWQD